jgi:hypothetical protein
MPRLLWAALGLLLFLLSFWLVFLASDPSA